MFNFISLTCYCAIPDISCYFPVYWWKSHPFFSSISLVVEVVVRIVDNKTSMKHQIAWLNQMWCLGQTKLIFCSTDFFHCVGDPAGRLKKKKVY